MKLINIWNNRKKILEGITNDIFRKEHVEIIASERQEICDTCEHKDVSGDSCIVPASQPCCSLCGCKLSWKVRALSEECPAKKWHALVDEETENEISKKLNL